VKRNALVPERIRRQPLFARLLLPPLGSQCSIDQLPYAANAAAQLTSLPSHYVVAISRILCSLIAVGTDRKALHPATTGCRLPLPPFGWFSFQNKINRLGAMPKMAIVPAWICRTIAGFNALP
jgi:hypothetical protein